MRWRRPPEPSSSFQEHCCLRRSWEGYFWGAGSNPAWRGRVGTTILPGHRGSGRPLGSRPAQAGGCSWEQGVGLPYQHKPQYRPVRGEDP